MICLVQLAIIKRSYKVYMYSPYGPVQLFVMLEKLRVLIYSLEIILLSMKQMPSSVCCNMCIEHRSAAHPLENPFS